MPDTQTTDALTTEIFDAFQGARRYDPTRTDLEASLLQVFRGLAAVIAARDERIANLAAGLADTTQANVSDLEIAYSRIAVLEARVAALQTQITVAQAAARETHAMAHAAIHSAADKRVTAADAQSQISRRDPLRQL